MTDRISRLRFAPRGVPRFPIVGAKVGASQSGGGSRGSWMVGVWKYCAHADLFPEGIPFASGVSVGSINSLALAMFPPGPDQVPAAVEVMEESWARLADTKEVWKLRFPPYLAGLWHNSIGDNSALRRLLEEVVDVEAIKTSGVQLRICACDLLTGEIHTFDQNGPVIAATLASSSFPIAFPLEPIKQTQKRPGGLYTDAGVRDISPARSVIEAGCDRALILLSRDPDRVPVVAAEDVSTVWSRTKREMDLMLTEIVRGDIAMARLINQVVRTGKSGQLGAPFDRYRDVPMDILFPSKPLGDSLQFERPVMLAQMDQGFEDAKAYFGG